MILFPFVEMIERLIRWAKNFGSGLFWAWEIGIGILGAILILGYMEVDNGFWKAMGILFIVMGITGIPVDYHEHKWKEKREKNKKLPKS